MSNEKQKPNLTQLRQLRRELLTQIEDIDLELTEAARSQYTAELANRIVGGLVSLNFATVKRDPSPPLQPPTAYDQLAGKDKVPASEGTPIIQTATSDWSRTLTLATLFGANNATIHDPAMKGEPDKFDNNPLPLMMYNLELNGIPATNIGAFGYELRVLKGVKDDKVGVRLYIKFKKSGKYYRASSLDITILINFIAVAEANAKKVANTLSVGQYFKRNIQNRVDVGQVAMEKWNEESKVWELLEPKNPNPAPITTSEDAIKLPILVKQTGAAPVVPPQTYPKDEQPLAEAPVEQAAVVPPAPVAVQAPATPQPVPQQQTSGESVYGPKGSEFILSGVVDTDNPSRMHFEAGFDNLDPAVYGSAFVIVEKFTVTFTSDRGKNGLKEWVNGDLSDKDLYVRLLKRPLPSRILDQMFPNVKSVPVAVPTPAPAPAPVAIPQPVTSATVAAAQQVVPPAVKPRIVVPVPQIVDQTQTDEWGDDIDEPGVVFPAGDDVTF